MIRYLEKREFTNDKAYVRIACTSSDTKPEAGIISGSEAVEVNTGKHFLFDEDSTGDSGWLEQSTAGGAGSFCVTITVDDSGDEPVYSADKTIAEIGAAADAGNLVIAYFTDPNSNDVVAYLNSYGDDYADFTGSNLTANLILMFYAVSIYTDSDTEAVVLNYQEFDMSTLVVE